MMTVAFGESTMSRTHVQLWYNWLKDDDPYSLKKVITIKTFINYSA